jgi:hypothetical protein
MLTDTSLSIWVLSTVHDCYNCHHWNGLCSFCWMLNVWALDTRIAQEWVGCIFDVGFDTQCVLFGWYKDEGVTSQVIFIIQKSNNMFIDMSQVVHIIQICLSCHVFTHFMLIFWKASILACDVLCLLPVYGTTYLDTSSISLIRTIWI